MRTGGRASPERGWAAYRGAGRGCRPSGQKMYSVRGWREQERQPFVVKIGRGFGGRGRGAAPFSETRKIMGRFDSRSTTKIRQRKAQAKKKARDARRAEETRAARQ